MKIAERLHHIINVFWKDHAYVIGLYSIAIGYPYIDTLGYSPFFFREHNAGPVTIISTLCIILLIIPLLLVCIMAGVKRLFPRIAGVVDFGYAIIMSCLASIYCNNSSLICKYIRFDWQETAYWQLCIITTTAMLLLFRWQKTRDIFRCAAVLPIILIFMFLFVLPSASLFRQPVTSRSEVISAIKNPIPIVIVILDGFSLQAILDCNGEIDRRRFPNIAALADTSYWFKNARTVAGLTHNVLPAMMTGTATHLNPKPSSISEYPHNLFSWLQLQYKNFSIQEWRPHVTLAPSSINTRVFLANRFITDLAGMPYYYFIFSFKKNNLAAKDSREWVTALFEYSLDLDKWLERIQPECSLNFCHLQQPHFPLNRNYDGKFYENSKIPVGLDDSFPRNNISLINLSFHQYILQCGYVDSRIGKIMERLKQKNIYDNALIIISGDHGTSFYPGVIRRGGISDIGLATTGFIPLIIKLPKQTTGVISERQATTIDLMPTICGVLQANHPWPMDGNDLFGKTFPTFDYDINSKRIFYNLFVLDKEPHYRSYSLISVQKTFKEMLQRKNLIIADNLPMNNTAANYTAEAKYNRLLHHDSADFSACSQKAAAIRANISNGLFLIAEITAMPPALSGCPLAITVHGKIAIITKPEPWREHRLLFGGMFPAADASPSSIEYFVIEEKQDRIVLHKISNVIYQSRSLLSNVFYR